MDVNRLLRMVESSSRVVSNGNWNGTSCIDMIMFSIVVDPAKARARKNDIIRELERYPVKGRLEEGQVSYREISNTLKISEEHSLRLMAIGKHLGLWDIDMPASGLHMLRGINTDTLMLEDARSGKIMISCYRVKKPVRKRRASASTG